MDGCGITSRTVLNRPHTHIYGQQEPVSGAIHLNCDSTRRGSSLPDCELQLDVHAVLCGHAMSKLWADSRRKRLLHTADVPLFSRRVNILRDVSQLRTNSTITIPFSVTFPQTTQTNLTSLLWQDGSRDVYHGNPEHALPPSTFARSSYAALPFLAVIEYTINTRVSIRYADSMLVRPSCATSIKIYYEGPQSGSGRLSRDFQIHRSHIYLNDRDSSHELDQVQGTRARIRSIISLVQHNLKPIGLVCRIPRRLEIGRPITCVLSLSDVHDSCQDPSELPMLYLASASLELYETMHARTERLAGNMLDTSQQTWLLDMDFMIDPCEPFHAGARHTKTISTRRLKELPISFATYNIARSFHAIIQIRIRSSTHERTIGFEQPVEVCSGIMEQNALACNRGFLPSGSQQNPNMHVSVEQGQHAASNEALPSYEDAVARAQS